jgi:hypothetical protein
MPLPPQKSKTTSNGPVNSRTARLKAVQQAQQQPRPVSQTVRQHLTRLHNRHQFGAPLVQRLRAVPVAVRRRVPWLWGLALPGVVGTGVAWVAHGGMWWLSWGLGLCGALGGAGVLVQHLQSRRDAPVPDAPKPIQVFDLETLAHLDQVLATMTNELSPTHAAALQALIDTIVRIAPVLGRTEVNEVFTQDDRFYVLECVRRYLPDSLQAYLQVPARARATPVDAHTPSPDALLLTQLQQMHTKLLSCEQALDHASTEALQRQQRFLAAREKSW